MNVMTWSTVLFRLREAFRNTRTLNIQVAKVLHFLKLQIVCFGALDLRRSSGLVPIRPRVGTMVFEDIQYDDILFEAVSSGSAVEKRFEARFRAELVKFLHERFGSAVPSSGSVCVAAGCGQRDLRCGLQGCLERKRCGHQDHRERRREERLSGGGTDP